MIHTLALLLLSIAGAETLEGLGAVGKVEKVEGGFAFTEGPAADTNGEVYFTDIPNEKIHKISADGKVSVFIEKSNHANGLMFDAKGNLVACEMDGQIAAHSKDGKKRTVLVDKHMGNRFNAPNDLVLDKAGGVYFTDPAFRAPMPLPQGKTGVYYLDTKGTVTRLIDNLPNPNGVILSPDEKTLYVIPTGQADMMAYPIEAPGKIGQGKVLCSLKQAAGKNNTGGDGLTMDVKGNLYITSGLGIQVFSPQGKHLGTIAFPEQPANCCFGGKDMKTLFVTARTSVYKVEMPVAGHRFSSK
ncbi:MAG: SMP-30/gluconolactonase/LRE family protein [Gemmataceae bacterium]